MRRQITTIISVVGLTLGPAAIASADPVSPDARDANLAAQQAQVTQTASAIRSPDARDANLAAQAAQSVSRTVSDPRSPDARDAANLVVVPAGVISASRPVSVGPSSPSGNGFDWGDAGMIAGGVALLALLALAMTIGVQHRRRPGTPLAH